MCMYSPAIISILSFLSLLITISSISLHSIDALFVSIVVCFLMHHVTEDSGSSEKFWNGLAWRGCSGSINSKTQDPAGYHPGVVLLLLEQVM